MGTWSGTLPPIGLAGQAATHFSQPPTWAYKQCAHSSSVCLHSFPYDVVRPGTPENVPARAYEEEKKKPECREVAVEIIASSYSRRYQNIFQRANGFLASPQYVLHKYAWTNDRRFPLA